MRLAESRGTWSDGRVFSAPEYSAQFALLLDRCACDDESLRRATVAWLRTAARQERVCSVRLELTQYVYPLARKNIRYFDPAIRRLEEVVAEATGIASHNGEDPIKLSRHGPPQVDSVRQVFGPCWIFACS